MITSKKLLKLKKINHGFFNKKGGKSAGIYKSLNCGSGSKDKKNKVKDNLKVNLEKDILKKPFRMGKYILIPTIKNKILLIHLGMSGQIKIQKKNHSAQKLLLQ